MNKFWYLLVIAALLIGAHGTWPSGYYQLVRWCVFIGGAYAAYLLFEEEDTGWAWIFCAAAILFNPIAPFYLTGSTWQVLDIITTLPFISFPFTRSAELSKSRHHTHHSDND